MAHPDLDELLNSLIPFAQQMLSKHGEFLPFGAALDMDGKVKPVAGDTGSEHPQSQELIDLLLSGFREQAVNGEIKAAGVCFDARVASPGKQEKTDAICSKLEHCAGDTVEVFLPYKKGWFGRIKYGEIFASPGTPVVFSEGKS